MITTQKFLENLTLCRRDLAKYYDYSKTVYNGIDNKIIIICPIHGEFSQRAGDHKRDHGCKKCGRLNAKNTNIQKYGAENPASSQVIKEKIKRKFIENYGVDNPSKDSEIKKKKEETCLKNYGVRSPMQSIEIRQKTINTNLIRYGFEIPIQNPTVAKKAMLTKIENGGFTKSNSSKSATKFIKKYIKENNYDVSQCAYADQDLGLHEWGIYHNGRWVLYDLVVFEKNFRGNKNKIIEILEYHGPFHYCLNDSLNRGNEKAYPWKSNSTLIKESYERDVEKEKLGKLLTTNYKIVYYNNEGDI